MLMLTVACLLPWCRPVHACNQLVVAAQALTTASHAKFACKCLTRHNTCLLKIDRAHNVTCKLQTLLTTLCLEITRQSMDAGWAGAWPPPPNWIGPGEW